MTFLRVLIADDHAIVRRGLRAIIADEFTGAEFGETTDGPQVLHAVRQGQWDVVLLDISVPGRGGLEIIKAIRDMRPKLPVLAMSIHSEDQYAIRAIRAGAAGYLSKKTTPQELIRAIREVLAQGIYISDSIGRKLAANLKSPLAGPMHEALSDREYEVMLMLASGKRVSDAAEELTLSVKTISTYRGRILDKMGMKTNADLTRYAMEENLLD